MFISVKSPDHNSSQQTVNNITCMYFSFISESQQVLLHSSILANAIHCSMHVNLSNHPSNFICKPQHISPTHSLSYIQQSFRPICLSIHPSFIHNNPQPFHHSGIHPSYLPSVCSSKHPPQIHLIHTLLTESLILPSLISSVRLYIYASICGCTICSVYIFL